MYSSHCHRGRGNSLYRKRHTITYKRLSLLLTIFLIPVAYAVSYFLLTYYVGGDQIAYHNFYNVLHGADFTEMLVLARGYVSSNEPLSALVLWAGSNLSIEKNVYISILNVFLVSGIFLLARKHRVNSLMILLLLTNFYVIVLMTGAERLKIAFIFLVFAALFAGKTRVALCVLSPFAHLQSLVLLPSVILASFEHFIRRAIVRQRMNKWTVGFLVFVAVLALSVVVPLFDVIMQKVTAYVAQDVALTELANVVILSAIALYATASRFRMFLILAPMYPAIAVLGGMRVNMVAVVLVVYYLMTEKRLHHPLVYALMVYFTLKSIKFVRNIYIYGNGFYGI